MTKPQGFLATFRIDEELWGKFKDIAKNKQTNASALIIQYIQGVISSGGVDSPQPNLDDIYKYIDNKLDNLEDVSIQDIDNKIAESLEDGDIKDAIAASYAGMMAQFNGLLEELQELKKQFEELKSIPPVPVPQPQINEKLTIDNEEPTTDNGQLTNEILTTLQETDNGQLTKDIECDRSDSDFNSDTQLPIAADIENLLEIGDILSGSPYDLNYLNSHIGDRLNEHKTQIEAALKIKLSLSEPKYICREFNKILRAMGLTIENKQIKKVETYWIEANNDKVPK